MAHVQASKNSGSLVAVCAKDSDALGGLQGFFRNCPESPTPQTPKDYISLRYPNRSLYGPLSLVAHRALVESLLQLVVRSHAVVRVIIDGLSNTSSLPR